MADYRDTETEGELNRTRIIGVVIDVAAWFVAATALGWGVYGVSQLAAGSPRVDLMTLVLVFMAMLGGAALLWGVAELIRRMSVLQALRELSAAREPGTVVVRSGGDGGGLTNEDSDRLNELVVLMREVRDISLLSEDQRRMRLEAQGKAVLAVTMREVPVLLREHNWIEARRRVQNALERFPMFQEWAALEQQIEQMRTQVEQHDIEAAERQIQDLKSLGAHDRVTEVVEELLERHPESMRAHTLAQRIREERARTEAEHRARLLANVQELANRRDWEHAMERANQLIRDFPKSTEAQSLRLDLPRLRENAEIQARKRLESEYAALVRDHQYDLAAELARQVIERYPQSPQAAAMREQLPKLQQRLALATRE